MAGDFFPRTDPAIPAWSNNLRVQLLADPLLLGDEPQLAQEYSDLHDAFVEAYDLTTSPRTKTPSATFHKNQCRRRLNLAAQRINRIVKANPNVSLPKRYDLGLNPRKRGGRNPLTPKPGSAPVVVVVSVAGRTVHLQLLNAESTRRGRAPHAKGAAVYMFVGEEPPATLAGWGRPHETIATRLALTLGPDVPPGAKIWFVARWKNARFQAGPASAAVFAHAGGGVGRLRGMRPAA